MNNSTTRNKKSLNRSNFKIANMKTDSKLKGAKLIKAIKQAQKDPEFIREINKFIRITTS